ncbi:MAG TPA: hypothetical protein VF022_01445, partial [Rhodanobacteraceae bacterium]
GIWMLQIFPAVIFGLFLRWFRPSALLLGWLAGMALGSALAYANGLKPVYMVAFGTGTHHGIYIGLIALVVNLVLAIVLTPVAVALRQKGPMDRTQSGDYEDAPDAVIPARAGLRREDVETHIRAADGM